MFYLPALNLFFYNALLSFMIIRVKRYTNGQKGDDSLWDYMLGSSRQTQLDQTMECTEFPKGLLNLNFFIHGLVLVPAFVQRRWFGLLLTIVLIWNIFIWERIFIFQLTLMWLLWVQDISLRFYILIVGCISFINVFHLMLIVDSIKLQRSCLASSNEGQADTGQVLEVGGGGDGPGS